MRVGRKWAAAEAPSLDISLLLNMSDSKKQMHILRAMRRKGNLDAKKANHYEESKCDSE